MSAETGNKKSDLTWGETLLFTAGSLVGAVAGAWVLVRLLEAMAAQAPGFWFVSRASGIVSYALLWLVTAWGVMLSAKTVGGIFSAPLAFALHNIASWLALGFATIHALSLLGDQVVPFTSAGVLLPFASSYQPLLTGLGTLSLYVGILVSVTFYMKKRIGYRAWRVIHMLSYLMFILVTVHGVALGTDSSAPAMRVLYLTAGGSVLFLTMFRALTAPAKAHA